MRGRSGIFRGTELTAPIGHLQERSPTAIAGITEDRDQEIAPT